MIPRRVVRELERQLTREPGNLTVRVTLAAAYRELGRNADAVEQYRLVAAAYFHDGRFDEAMSACASARVMAADDRDLVALEGQIRAGQAAAPTGPRWGAMAPSVASGRGGARVADRAAERAAERSAGASASDLETPLPPPMPLHEAPGDSLIGLPRGIDSGVTTGPISTLPPGTLSGSSPSMASLPSLPSLGSPPSPPPLPPAPSSSSLLSSPSSSTPQGTLLGAGVGRLVGTGPVPRLSAPPAPQPRPGALPPRVVERTTRRLVPDDDPDLDFAEDAAEDFDLLDVGSPVVALTEVRRAGLELDERSSSDLASELATRRRPKLSPHELDLLDLEILVVPAEPAPVAATPDLADTALDAPALPGDEPAVIVAPVPTDVAVAGPPRPSDYVDDEPTQPPGPGHADGDGGTFAGGFTGTLAELAPDGAALDGPLGVFSMLSGEAAIELGRRAVVKLFDDGEVVVREGDVGDACYVIARGEVVVTRQAGLGQPPIELARLGDGALFGEFALLADRRRHATVTALGEAELYVVPRLLLRELAAVFPDVGPALERFYRERLLANLITTSPLFARLAVDQRAGLLTAFEPMRVESGQAIVRQGERAGGLFLIVLGAVEVVCRTDDRRAVVLATLGEGAYVGEISLLTGDVATASVVACGPVELAALPAAAFYRVVSEYPELWVAMRDEADARRLHTARVLSGRTAVV